MFNRIQNRFFFYLVLMLLAVSCSSQSDNQINSPEVLVIEEQSPITDFDGNIYKTIKIGNQIWMAENLKSKHNKSGNVIQYFEYNNDSSLVQTYGRLYNRAAIMKGIAPEGWHIPSKSEWEELANYLGGMQIAGGKMKEQGTTHWLNPNTAATNESKFNALPGGMHDFTNIFQWLGEVSCFASSSQTSDGDNSCFYIESGSSVLKMGGFHPDDAFSVRCIKNK